MAAALIRWPFCRGPRDPAAFPDRALFAPPELTGYLYDTPADHERVLAEAEDVEVGLPDWSRAFPEVTFALVEADCFGGRCAYFGYCCRDGGQFLVRDRCAEGSLLELVAGVGIKTTGPFDPFVRGFFAGPGSGGFK